jgi:hypothetical protein
MTPVPSEFTRNRIHQHGNVRHGVRSVRIPPLGEVKIRSRFYAALLNPLSWGRDVNAESLSAPRHGRRAYRILVAGQSTRETPAPLPLLEGTDTERTGQAVRRTFAPSPFKTPALVKPILLLDSLFSGNGMLEIWVAGDRCVIRECQYSGLCSAFSPPYSPLRRNSPGTVRQAAQVCSSVPPSFRPLIPPNSSRMHPLCRRPRSSISSRTRRLFWPWRCCAFLSGVARPESVPPGFRSQSLPAFPLPCSFVRRQFSNCCSHRDRGLSRLFLEVTPVASPVHFFGQAERDGRRRQARAPSAATSLHSDHQQASGFFQSPVWLFCRSVGTPK